MRALHAPVDIVTEQLGLHGDDHLGLEPQGLGGVGLPETGLPPSSSRDEKRTVLRMEFRTFVNALVRMPCQIVRTAADWSIGCWPGIAGKRCCSARSMCCVIRYVAEAWRCRASCGRCSTAPESKPESRMLRSAAAPDPRKNPADARSNNPKITTSPRGGHAHAAPTAAGEKLPTNPSAFACLRLSAKESGWTYVSIM